MKIEIDTELSVEDNIITMLPQFSFDQVAKLKRWIDAVYEDLIRTVRGYTPDELEMLSLADRIKSVRVRTGVNLVTAKELCERWDREQR